MNRRDASRRASTSIYKHGREHLGETYNHPLTDDHTPTHTPAVGDQGQGTKRREIHDQGNESLGRVGKTVVRASGSG